MSVYTLCETCRYFRGRLGSIGTCRRYPPTRTENVTAFPEVEIDEECGEWKSSELHESLSATDIETIGLRRDSVLALNNCGISNLSDAMISRPSTVRNHPSVGEYIMADIHEHIGPLLIDSDWNLNRHTNGDSRGNVAPVTVTVQPFN